MQRRELISLAVLHGYPASFCRSRKRRPGTPSALIFDAYCDEVRSRIAKLPVWVRWIAIAQWPLSVTLAALWMVAANGGYAARTYNRGIVAQFADQIRLAFAEGLFPTTYYLWELHDPRHRERADAYIQRCQVKTAGKLYKRFYRADPERNARAKLLNDKLGFARFLADRGLPAPVPVAQAEKGRLDFDTAGAAALPPGDLFVKPKCANGGQGTERWTYAAGLYRGNDGRSLCAQGLAGHLAERSRETPLLIQECLHNHRGLAGLSAGALSTLRIYTCWNERGEVEHLFTMLRMSQDTGRIVDNVCKGGLAAEVDPQTGKLGRATDGAGSARCGWLERHPVTGAPIAGVEVPCWDEALQLVLTAHEKFKSAAFIGWDVAITEHGPVIVEGNKAPDITIEQRLGGAWADRRMGELFAYHLKAAKRDAARPSAARSLHPAA